MKNSYLKSKSSSIWKEISKFKFEIEFRPQWDRLTHLEITKENKVILSGNQFSVKLQSFI